MGVYVYTMRATKRNVEIDGTKVEANLLSFISTLRFVARIVYTYTQCVQRNVTLK